MNPVLRVIILCAIMWILNFILGFIQIKHFNKHYIEMRRLGRVAIGRKKGYLSAGIVIMLAIDDKGQILKTKKMQGMSIMARVKEFVGLEGKNINSISQDDLNIYNKLVRVAISDAIKNYNTLKGGEKSCDTNDNL